MRHNFSSGEILHRENIKELDEGVLVADCLVYDKIDAETEYICVGKINEKNVNVKFKLDSFGAERVLFKNSLNILMQSDIFKAKWAKYRIEE
ncbi:MAG: hypothetical protein GX045_04630 [Clostridiaceae bacterium]|nr:hypothetical protein [Clostridiaceae bacterium]